MSDLHIIWKEQSNDLLQIYEQLGLVSCSFASIDSWTRNNFTTWDVEIINGERSKRVHYTSVFTCPVTGMHFPSGKLAESQLVDIDGVNYYKTKKRAIQAAAAKAIDNFMSQGEFQRCYDISIMLSSGPALPPFPYSIAIQLKKKRLRSGRWASAYEHIKC